MYSTILALVLALLCMDTARAGIFVVQPLQDSTCRAGKPCTITWVDDGSRPLLTAIGWSTVGLYTGKQKLVQAIPPVDVTANRSMTFIPNAAAGPDSDKYFVAIASASLKNDNGTAPYTAWSASFRLVGMSGSFDTPLPAATVPIPVPASLIDTTASSTPSTTMLTITVGASSTRKSGTASRSASASSSSAAASSATPSASAPASSSPSVSPSPSSSPSASSTHTPSGLTTLILPSATIPVSTDPSSTAALPPSTPSTTANSGTISGVMVQPLAVLVSLSLVLLSLLS
ncbi:hypothetical protein D9619_009579 [Psilocybe cf. subviscida]|uniref:DOMON domain-containing protein n=1 Tax=Psilocybe cf. subviscida TaxID=2480587 RepID=A0A8H5F6N3_9AGAR|nr:hypothetical protein D9619_009579 [Psilocybe cf. subviscida]